jgi:mono/diheme cytochrome c family protein
MILAGGLFVLATALMSQTKKPQGAGGQKPAAGAANKGSGLVNKGGGLKATLTRGLLVYQQTCLACHQADALGVQNMNPPLVKTNYVLGDKKVLVQIVLKGMTGEVEIDGETYHNVMAPHSDLSDLQIADVLTYIRNSFGNKASAVSPAEVKVIRAKTK